MDKAGAVNIMFHSEKVGGNYGAEWYIWPQESIAAIASAIRPGDGNSSAVADSILSEMHCVDKDAQRAAFLQSGWPTWRLMQQPGDAVFIPPRCPHQVRRRRTFNYVFSHLPRSPTSDIA
jgi:hypothetical protein